MLPKREATGASSAIESIELVAFKRGSVLHFNLYISLVCLCECILVVLYESYAPLVPFLSRGVLELYDAQCKRDGRQP